MREELNENQQELIGRIVEEFLSELRNKEKPRIEDYVARHPDLGSSLRAMLQLVSKLETQSTIDTSRAQVSGFETPLARAGAEQFSVDSIEHNLSTEFASDESTIASSRRIGKFEMLEKIGQGGFGQVWKARDTQLGRLVAIKLLRKHMIDDQATRERFLREARAAGQLRHPNIVPVYEVADLDGVPAIISSLVHGVTLKELLQCRALSIRESAALLVDVCSAIQYAHSVNLIHRDIKPANIMIEYDANEGLSTPIDTESYSRQSGSKSSVSKSTVNPIGRSGPRPLVLDFGLALRDEIEATMTVEGQVLGTPAYMSPEQARGQGHDVDGRTDVYALGAVLYEMICGEPPFSGSKVAILHQVLHDEPRAPRIVRPNIPKDVETICLKALAKVPAQRYSTAGEFMMDLLRWLRDEPILARRPTTLEQLRRWTRRYPALAGSVIGIFLMLIIFSSVAVVYALKFQQLAFNADQARQKADQSRAQEALALQASNATLQRMYTSFGIQSERNGQPIQGAPWFTKAIEQVNAQPESKETSDAPAHWLRLQNCSLTSAVPVRAWWLRRPDETLATEPTALQWHPAGQWLIVRSVTQVETIWNLTDNTHVDLRLIQSVLSPSDQDAGRLADEPIASCVWSLDGKHLFACNQSGALVKVETGSWKLVKRFAPGTRALGINLSEDGKKLVITTETGLLILNADQLSMAAKFSCPLPWKVAINPSASQVACGDAEGRVRVAEFDSNSNSYNAIGNYSAVVSTIGLGSAIQFLDSGSLAWHSPDNSLAVVNPPDDSVTIWQKGEVSALRFSPTGRFGFFTTGFLGRLVDTSNGKTIGEFIRHRNNILDISFSHNERMVATASGDRTVGVYDTLNGEPIIPLIQHQADMRRVAFSPDSKYLATAQLDGLVRIWKMPSNYERMDTGSSDQFLETSADGTRIIAGPWQSARSNTSLQLFDTVTRKAVGMRFSQNKYVDGAFLSPKSADNVLVTLANNPETPGSGKPDQNQGSIIFWNATTGATSEPIHSRGVLIGGAWSPNASLAATVDFVGDVLVLDTNSHQVIKRLLHGDSHAPLFVTRRHIAFSPDGKKLAVWTRLRTSVWDTTTWNMIMDYHVGLPQAQHFTHNSVFSSDSRYLAICTSFKKACVLDLHTQKCIAELLHPDWVFNADFSPDDKHLATTCRDGQVRIWDWRNGQQVLTPLQHQDEAWGVDYSADGRWLITGGRDLRVRLWDAKSGEPITPAIRMPYWVYDVRFLDKQQLAVASGQGKNVYFFDTRILLGVNQEMASGSAQELELYSQLISSQRIVQQDVANLTTEDWVRVWNEVYSRESLPDYKVLSEEARLLAMDKKIRSVLRNAASLGQWSQCRYPLVQLIECNPHEWRAYFELCVVLSHDKDYRALKELQDLIVARFGDMRNTPSEIEQVSKSLLVNASLSQHNDLGIELAELAASNLSGGGYDGWFRLNLGLARLRQKRYREAEEIFDQIQGPLVDMKSHVSVVVCAYNAQTKYGLGKQAEAEALLKQAHHLLLDNTPGPSVGSFYPADWSDWLRAIVILRDALELIAQ